MENLGKFSDKQIKSPHNIPMSIYIQEAETLYHWALEDKDALTAAGLAMEFINDLPNLCEIATKAEAQLYVEINTKKNGIVQWEKQAPLAFELRKQLLHHFRLAFRGYPHLMETLKDISRGGRSYAKQIQDLNDLAVLGKTNSQILNTIHFDMSLLDKAAQASTDMSALLAEANRDRLEPNEAKRSRDLAYTNLKEAVDEIRFYGRHVFHGNKERLVGYRSVHIRELKIKQAHKKKFKMANPNEKLKQNNQ